MITSRYLGDGVYAAVENGMIKVYTSDGLRETNVVFLELEVYDALVKFVEDAKAVAAAQQKAP